MVLRRLRELVGDEVRRRVARLIEEDPRFARERLRRRIAYARDLVTKAEVRSLDAHEKERC